MPCASGYDPPVPNGLPPAIRDIRGAPLRRAGIMLTAVFTCLLIAFGFGATSAWAVGEALQGTLTNNTQPVSGVKVTAFDEGGQRIGEATSDAECKWKLELPGSARFSVDLD